MYSRLDSDSFKVNSYDSIFSLLNQNMCCGLSNIEHHIFWDGSLNPKTTCKINWVRKYFYARLFTASPWRNAILVVGPLRLSATLLGCLVCVIGNSKSIHFLVFKLCIMNVQISKICTSKCVHLSWIFS